MTIEEIDERIKKLDTQMKDLYKQRDKIKAVDNNFVNKCIYLPGHGFIKVKEQLYDHSEDTISLFGECFDYGENEYFYYDVYRDVTLGIDSFLSLIKFKEFKEISEEEFAERLENMRIIFTKRLSKNNVKKQDEE